MADILLVDDVAIVRTALSKFMSREGHAVTECGGGEEAAKALDRSRFDIIVTDLWMKAGSGLQLIERARAQGLRTPIIAITTGNTGSAAATDAGLALRAGADHVLFKPVTRAALVEAIAKLLGAPAAA